MPTNTPNLDLYKKNPATDGADTFNITTMLNDNWDKIDTATGKLSDLTTTVKTNLVAGINEIQNQIDEINSVPVGTVIWFAKNIAPSGYLKCDGGAISRTNYADLFAVIGTTFGVGDSSTTFNLPNLTDSRFIEGSGTVGTKYDAGLPNITGQFGSNNYGHKIDNPSGAFSSSGSTYDKPPYTDTSGGSILKFKASSSNSIYGNSSTVQPPALTMLPCIKY